LTSPSISHLDIEYFIGVLTGQHKLSRDTTVAGTCCVYLKELSLPRHFAKTGWGQVIRMSCVWPKQLDLREVIRPLATGTTALSGTAHILPVYRL
jgi:hypothetical protein